MDAQPVGQPGAVQLYGGAVGLLRPAPPLSSPEQRCPLMRTDAYSFPRLISELGLSRNPGLVPFEVYIVSWPLVNIALRKAPITSFCLFRGKIGGGCC